MITPAIILAWTSRRTSLTATGEWTSLRRFVAADRRGATLGLVYGRRRQGKTYLLQALGEAAGGTYLTGLQQSAEQNLARFAAGYQVAMGARGRVVFSNWEEAFSALLSLGEGARTPALVVVDEFPYPLVANPEIPSTTAGAAEPAGVSARRHLTRLVLCGSALSTMRGLLIGTAPLRAGLALAHGSSVLLSRGGRLLGHRRQPGVVRDAARPGWRNLGVP